MSLLLPRRQITPTALVLDPASYGGKGFAQPLLALLDEMHIKNYRLTPDLIDKPEARPGTRGREEWVITPQGRAIQVGDAKDRRWTEL